MSGYPMQNTGIVAWFKEVRDAIRKHDASKVADFAILLNLRDSYDLMMSFLDANFPIKGKWAGVHHDEIPQRVRDWKSE